MIINSKTLKVTHRIVEKLEYSIHQVIVEGYYPVVWTVTRDKIQNWKACQNFQLHSTLEADASWGDIISISLSDSKITLLTASRIVIRRRDSAWIPTFDVGLTARINIHGSLTSIPIVTKTRQLFLPVAREDGKAEFVEMDFMGNRKNTFRLKAKITSFVEHKSLPMIAFGDENGNIGVSSWASSPIDFHFKKMRASSNLQTESLTRASVVTLSFFPKSLRLVSTDQSGSVKMWDGGSRTLLHQIACIPDICAMEVSGDETTLFMTRYQRDYIFNFPFYVTYRYMLFLRYSKQIKLLEKMPASLFRELRKYVLPNFKPDLNPKELCKVPKLNLSSLSKRGK